jgi:hypothetical protein
LARQATTPFRHDDLQPYSCWAMASIGGFSLEHYILG